MKYLTYYLQCLCVVDFKLACCDKEMINGNHMVGVTLVDQRQRDVVYIIRIGQKVVI